MFEHLYLFNVPDHVKRYAIRDKQPNESLSQYISRLIIKEHKRIAKDNKESQL